MLRKRAWLWNLCERCAVIQDTYGDRRKICPDEEGGCDEDGEEDGDQETPSDEGMKFAVSGEVDDALDN